MKLVACILYNIVYTSLPVLLSSGVKEQSAFVKYTSEVIGVVDNVRRRTTVIGSVLLYVHVPLLHKTPFLFILKVTLVNVSVVSCVSVVVVVVCLSSRKSETGDDTEIARPKLGDTVMDDTSTSVSPNAFVAVVDVIDAFCDTLKDD